MDEGAVEAVEPAVELHVEPQRVGDEPDDRVRGHGARLGAERPDLLAGEERVVGPAAGATGQAGHVVGRELGPLGHVQAEGDGPRRATGSEGREDDLGRVRVDADVPFGRRSGVAGRAVGAAHDHEPFQEVRELRLAQDGDARLVSGPSVTSVISPGRRRASATMRSAACRSESGVAGWRQLGVADPARAVGLGGGDERPDERRLAAEGDFDVAAARQLEHRPRVLGDLARVDVAGDAGHGDELGVGRGAGVEQGQAVVDAGVAVDEQGSGAGTSLIVDGRRARRRPYTWRHECARSCRRRRSASSAAASWAGCWDSRHAGLGYRVAVLDPNPECPAASVADRVIVGSYDDPAAGLVLAAASAVVTYEFEQIDPAVVRAIEARVPVRPGVRPLSVARDRLAERAFLEGMGAPVADWRPVRSAADLHAAAADLGFPIRLKAATGGYDGRQQARITDAAGLDRALAGWPDLEARPALVERDLDFESELSVVVARSLGGEVAHYPAVRNRHRDGILVETSAPSPATLDSRRRAERLADQIASDLEMVGVLAVEMFRMRDGTLLVNELAPRVHNSGHWTIEGARTSQFEQHIRAICGLPLGSVEMVAPGAAMVNLLGDGSERAAKPEGLEAALRDPGVSVHLYDKRRVFERRKMGHVTVVADSMGEALRRARRAAAAIHWSGDPG